MAILGIFVEFHVWVFLKHFFGPKMGVGGIVIFHDVDLGRVCPTIEDLAQRAAKARDISR